MTNREKFTEIFGYEIAQHDTGEAIPGHCKILIASDNHFNEWLKQEYVPSAQLAQDLPKGCTDTISRQAAQRLFEKALIYKEQQGKWIWGTEEVKELIADLIKVLPSAQPEIIHCKDCKFYTPMNRETKTGICCLLMHQNFGDDWYCAGAEGRTDG